MAIYHFSRSYVSRSTGRSSVAASAYICAEKFYDDRQGLTHNYSNKSGVLYEKVFAPDGTKQELLNHETLWNRAEKFEDDRAFERFPANYSNQEKNEKSISRREHIVNSARVAISDNVALPKELTLKQNIKLVEEFVKEQYVSHGLAASVAIHFDEGNPHFHVLCTTRTLINNEFSKNKFRALNDRSFLKEQRSAFAKITNKHLELNGRNERIDHRSYKDQGLEIEATHHQSWQSKELEKSGKHTRIGYENEIIKDDNIQKILKDPSQIIIKVANQKAVFTKSDIAAELFKVVGGDEQLFNVLHNKIMGIDIPNAIGRCANDNNIYEGKQSDKERLEFKEKLRENIALMSDKLIGFDEIKSLGKDVKNRDIYTSSSYKRREENIQSLLENIETQPLKKLPESILSQEIKNVETLNGFELSPDQKAAIYHISKEDRVSLVTGRAGTGKTTMLLPIANAYKSAGYRVLGASALGKAVDIMEREIGIKSKTLDNFRVQWKEYEKLEKKIISIKGIEISSVYARNQLAKLQESQLTSKDVLILDEANMVGTGLWEPLLKQIDKSGAKLIVVQDPNQLKAVGSAGDVGSSLIKRFGSSDLTTIYRQKTDWQKQASKHFNNHNVREGLELYKENITFKEGINSSKWSIVESYIKDKDKYQNQMVLAFKNEDVKDLNFAIRNQLKAKGALGRSFNINDQEYSIGDKICFTKNDIKHVNTTFSSKVKSVFSHGTLDNLKQGVKNGNTGEVVSFNEKTNKMKVSLDDSREVEFNVLKYKSFSHGYATTIHKSEGETTDKTYLLLSRGMNANLTLVGATRHKQDLEMYSSRDQFKNLDDMSFKISKTDHRLNLEDYSISKENRPYFENVQEFLNISVKRGDLLDKINNKESSWDEFNKLNVEYKSLSKEIVSNWDQHKNFCIQANLRKDVLEYSCGIKEKPLNEVQVKAALYISDYFKLSQNVRTLYRESSPDYKEQRSIRNEMAYEIASNQTLYKPLVKSTFEKGKYIDVSGKVYDQKPGDWVSVVNHSSSYIKSKSLDYYKSRLDDDAKTSFEELNSYKQNCSDVACLISKIKNNSNNIIIDKSDLFKSLETSQKTRDSQALNIISNIEKFESHFKKLEINEEKLLNSASRYEGNDKESIVYENSFNKWYEADLVLKAANNKLDLIACNLLGKPNQAMSNAHEYRFGQSGKIVFTRTGSKAGLWHDFSSGKGGNIFNLINQEMGGSFKDNVRYLADYIGYEGQSKTSWIKSKPSIDVNKEEQGYSKEQRFKISKVKEQYKNSIDIEGTLASSYLKNHRSINSTLESSDIRFMPNLWNSKTKENLPALIAFARNKQGEITGRQAIYLDKDTHNKADIDIKKVSYGVIKGSFVEVQKGSGKTYVAEGLESALSIKEAGVRGRIVASLGISNIKNIDDNKDIIICSDNDGPDSQTNKLIDKSKIQLEENGKSVSVIKPDKDGQDFNDVLKEEGLESLKDSVKGQILNKEQDAKEVIQEKEEETTNDKRSESDKLSSELESSTKPDQTETHELSQLPVETAQDQITTPEQFEQFLDKYELSEFHKEGILDISKTSIEYAFQTLDDIEAKLKPEHDPIYQSSEGSLTTHDMKILIRDFEKDSISMKYARSPEKIEGYQNHLEELSKELEPYKEFLNDGISEKLEEFNEERSLIEQQKIQEQEAEKDQQRSYDFSL